MSRTPVVDAGDVYEVQLGDDGLLGYVQCLYPVEFGWLLRALVFTAEQRPPELQEIVDGPELFFSELVNVALGDAELFQHVGNYPIPAHAQGFIPLRHRGGFMPDGGKAWVLRLEHGLEIVPELTAEQRTWSVAGYTPLHMIRLRIREGWRPEHVPDIPVREPQPADGDGDGPAEVVHYLYSADREPLARVRDEAGGVSPGQGRPPFQASLRRSSDDEWRLALSTAITSGDQIDDDMDRLTALADRHGVEYDGHEVAVGGE